MVNAFETKERITGAFHLNRGLSSFSNGVFFIPCLKAKRLVCLHIDFFFFQFAPAFVFVCSSLSGYKVSFSLSLTFYLLSASFAVARCLSVSVCVRVCMDMNVCVEPWSFILFNRQRHYMNIDHLYWHDKGL